MATKHFGYWIFGKDMINVNLTTLKNNGVTDIFLNFYAITTHGTSKVESWVAEAKKNNINVHIWVQCFYNGDWINPAKTNLTSKLKEIQKYSTIKGIKGIHLDYLRYPGNAYKTNNGAKAITDFVKKVRSQNKNITLSCAVMPEEECKYYYGQDIDAWKGVVDFIIPMQYKGNYEAGTKWLGTTTKFFSSKITTWSGLQTYKSDDDTTKLSNTELTNDIKTCLDNKAQGVILFRYGLSTNINFKSLQSQEEKNMATKITAKELHKQSKTLYWNIRNIGQNGQSSKWAYYYCKAILNGKKDVPKTFGQAKANKVLGNSINVKMTKKQYLAKMKAYCGYIEKHKKLPNQVTILGKYKCTVAVWTAYVGYLYKVYYETGKLPASEPIRSDIYHNKKAEEEAAKKKVYNYLTNSGCSGMGQCTAYYCACNSLQQCFYRLTGNLVSESTIAGWAGTTEDGTDHDGINTAVAAFNRKYGKNVKIAWYNFSELSWSKINDMNKKGAVFFHLLYRDQYGHYEPIKSIGDYLEILNSLGDRCDYPAYCGYIEERSKGTQQSYINGISQKSVAYLYNG